MADAPKCQNALGIPRWLTELLKVTVPVAVVAVAFYVRQEVVAVKVEQAVGDREQIVARMVDIQSEQMRLERMVMDNRRTQEVLTTEVVTQLKYLTEEIKAVKLEILELRRANKL